MIESSSPPPVATARKRFGRRGILIVSSLLLLSAAGCFLTWRLWRYSVEVVNGLPVAYTVILNDTEVTLPAEGHVAVRLRQGKVSVRSRGAGVNIPDQSFDLHIPLFSGTRHVTVINPDRVAMLTYGGQEYTAYPRSVGGHSTSSQGVQAGSLVYQFPRVDYCFEAMPQTVQGSGSAYLWHLGLVRYRDPDPVKAAVNWKSGTGQWGPAISSKELVDRRIQEDAAFAAIFGPRPRR